jgi:hypothetical protein
MRPFLAPWDVLTSVFATQNDSIAARISPQHITRQCILSGAAIKLRLLQNFHRAQKEIAMKHFITALTLTVCISTLALGAEPIEYVPTPGESATVASPTQEDDSTGFSVEIFPKEIYLGDTIYLALYYENRSDEKTAVSSGRDDYWHGQFILSSPSLEGDYRWIPEYRTSRMNRRAGVKKEIKPGEKYPVQKIALEFPPLEDWNAPFWQELKATISEEGIVCKLQVSYRSANLEHDVLVKPRPANETALLDQWLNDTPETQAPVVERTRKVPYTGFPAASGKSNISIRRWKYEPWLFIRLGNRKPADPNNPTTLEGWRDLEASLTPSTMRDEIRFTRLQLEYYAAAGQAKTAEKAKSEFVDWLKSLPEIQRTVMTKSLVSKQYDFYEKAPLRAANRELMRALYDILDVGSQGIVCNFESIKYNDRTLTPPPGFKVIRPFMDVVTPTPEDLAHGSKDLPDGFRIWDADGDSGAVRIVAQYVELKESENTLVLKNREGLWFNMIFSALSEEDKEHARAMSQAAAEKTEGE